MFHVLVSGDGLQGQRNIGVKIDMTPELDICTEHICVISRRNINPFILEEILQS